MKRDLGVALFDAQTALSDLQPLPLAGTVPALERHLAAAPGDARANRHLARCYAEVGDPAAADCLAEALAEGPVDPRVHRKTASLDPRLAAILDPDTPLVRRYAALRQAEATLRPGLVAALWLWLTREGSDTEARAAAAERLRPRLLDGLTTPSCLPTAARRGLARHAEAACEEALALAEPVLGDDAENRLALAAALGSETQAAALVHRLRRKAGRDRERLPLYLRAVALLVGLNPALDPVDFVADLPTWQPEGEDPVSLAARSALAVAHAQRREWDRAVTLADALGTAWLPRLRTLLGILEEAGYGTWEWQRVVDALPAGDRPDEVRQHLERLLIPPPPPGDRPVGVRPAPSEGNRETEVSAPSADALVEDGRAAVARAYLEELKTPPPLGGLPRLYDNRNHRCFGDGEYHAAVIRELWGARRTRPVAADLAVHALATDVERRNETQAFLYHCHVAQRLEA